MKLTEEKVAEILAKLKKMWDSAPDLVWCRCHGKGSWQEQIDGPTNLRTVYCHKPEHQRLP